MSGPPHAHHRPLLRHWLRPFVFGTLALGSLSLLAGCSSPGGTRLRFEVMVPESVRSEPVTGRVFVMISRSDQREPRFQVGRTGVPFFGVDVEGLPPGSPAVIDGSR